MRFGKVSFLALVLAILMLAASGCADFLEDYSYNPISPIGAGSSTNSGSY